MNIFEQASKNKLRFPSRMGGPGLTLEDLWDLPLISPTRACLDNTAVLCNNEVINSQVGSFVNNVVAVSAMAELKLAIVKHIIAHKLAIADVAKKASITKARNNTIREIIAAKENETLQNMDLDKLKAMLDE